VPDTQRGVDRCAETAAPAESPDGQQKASRLKRVRGDGAPEAREGLVSKSVEGRQGGPSDQRLAKAADGRDLGDVTTRECGRWGVREERGQGEPP